MRPFENSRLICDQGLARILRAWYKVNIDKVFLPLGAAVDAYCGNYNADFTWTYTPNVDMVNCFCRWIALIERRKKELQELKTWIPWLTKRSKEELTQLQASATDTQKWHASKYFSERLERWEDNWFANYCIYKAAQKGFRESYWKNVWLRKSVMNEVERRGNYFFKK